MEADGDAAVSRQPHSRRRNRRRLAVNASAEIFIEPVTSVIEPVAAIRCFFAEIMNNSRHQKTVVTKEVVIGRSMFSTEYLGGDDRYARANVLRVFRWFGIVWGGGIVVGLAVGWVVGVNN